MQKELRLTPETWATIEKTAIGALIVGAVGYVLKFLAGIQNKVDKADLEKTLRERDAHHNEKMLALESRIARWEEAAQKFATREALSELDRKLDRMETRIEQKLDQFWAQIINLLKQER